jgi:HPt (histidine-containing phosphotransfer) domain-containing protein
MFEKTKALDVFQISVEEYDELLKEFIVQADLKIKAVESALENGDAETVAREIHSFKGVAGNMRLDDCYEAVKAVESALRSNDNASAKKLLLSLRTCVDEIRASIQHGPHCCPGGENP